MAKFYQHMEPGTNLGKVTQLKYIDDISDDELILYVFKDGTKSDESYIAEVNSMEAFNGRYMFVELSEPNNKWTFIEKEFNVAKVNTRNIDGVTYEVPDPGLSITRDGEGNMIAGDHVFMGTEMSENGTGIPAPKTLSKSGKRTDATPPRISKNVRVEPKENYLLSLHPELLIGETTNVVNENNNDILSHTVNRNNGIIKNIGKVSNSNNIQQETKSEEITCTVQTVVNNKPINESQKIVVPKNTPVYNNNNSPISTAVVETVKHASININVDDILSNEEFDKVNLIIGGKTEEITIKDFVNRLKQISVTPKEYSPFDDPNYKEDTLITNMIDKSKKKVYKIGVDVELALPPKSVYQTIKEVYPDGMADNFVTSIARRMNDTSLKEALANGLTAYYESTVNSSKNEDQNLQE